MYSKMEQSLKHLRDTTFVELTGEPNSPETYSDKLCNVYILRNCLAFINRGYDFPLGEICKIVSQSHASHPLEDAMDKILDVLQMILKNNRTIYALTVVQTFGLALQIFCGALYKLGGNEQMQENRASVLRSIKGMSDGLKKLDDADFAKKTEQFYDEMCKFLTRMSLFERA